MDRATAYILALTGWATFVIGATSRLPPFLSVTEFLAATAMLSSSVYLLITEEQFLR